ncbi:hypothetical protein NC651_029519 [Populus alba x Populus x berolinensis]|nr:hypothetical protein NC651_029519 [Populus alba x Populus x berolinensis]
MASQLVTDSAVPKHYKITLMAFFCIFTIIIQSFEIWGIEELVWRGRFEDLCFKGFFCGLHYRERSSYAILPVRFCIDGIASNGLGI